MSEIERTQGEWSVRTTPNNPRGVYWREIICGDECVIGEIYYSDTGDAEASANAALIVRAVNSHYKLIEALDDLLKWAIEAQEQIDPDWSGEYFEDSNFGRAAAAIAKARGE